MKSGYLPDPFNEKSKRGNPKNEDYAFTEWSQSLLWIDPVAGDALGIWDKE